VATSTVRLAALDWGGWATRFVFFTGKGGVGKTTIAAASAVRLADAGQRILLVSTDPASNLADVLGAPAGREHPVPVAGVPGLDVLDLDPQAAAGAYRERVLRPYRGVLPPGELAAFTEQLAGACTVEVAAFDAFARLLTDAGVADRYDHVVFDTAPTGHTLRLLALPAAWSGYLVGTPEGTSCLGPPAALDTPRAVYEAAVAALGDGTLTTVVLVARPDRAALAEAGRAAGQLAALGITRQQLVVNAVLTDPLQGDAVAASYAAAQRDALAALPGRLAGLPAAQIPLSGEDLTGVAALRALTSATGPPPAAAAPPVPAGIIALPGLDELIDMLATGPARAILVTGKGGVGKTAIASGVALGLARRGLPVHLSTTDPAGRLPQLEDAPAWLTLSRIDPAAETASYVAGRLEAARGLGEHRRELLEEELRSPCITELAVFGAFSGLLMRARGQHVIIDTAPTGHTLLLLDVTGAYHRQAMRSYGHRAGRVVTPLMRLQDPGFSRLLIVTLAERTPVAEASELQDDLRRAGVEPFGWVINASLAAAGTRDPLLARRAALEQPHIHRVATELASRAWLAPWDPATIPDRQLAPAG
jgi:arsenite-transporting ATPase